MVVGVSSEVCSSSHTILSMQALPHIRPRLEKTNAGNTETQNQLLLFKIPTTLEAAMEK